MTANDPKRTVAFRVLFPTFARNSYTGDTTLITRTALLFVSACILASCQRDTSADNAEEVSIVVLPFGSDCQLPNLDEYLKEFELSPGVWREKNGSKICDGYMTRFENEDYCSAKVPEGWVPFQYNGETYYVQPLAGSDIQNSMY